MKTVLISWLSREDILAAKGDKARGVELILGTLKARPHDALHLLVGTGGDGDPEFGEAHVAHSIQTFKEAVRAEVDVDIEVERVTFRSPTHYGDLYECVREVLERLNAQYGAPQCAALLTPGSPQMHAVWLLLCKTSFPIRMLENQRPPGGVSVVREVDAPFDISADYVPAIVKQKSATLTELAANAPRVRDAFRDIKTQCPEVRDAIERAQGFAVTDLPVLILGETGTGKELFARAIHHASSRAHKTIVVVNCGAIAKEIVDSELFGYVKGAFTGATKDKEGLFAAADGSTIFLDEFGELPPATQVKLLRVLNDGKFLPVGGVAERQVDVRVIAATNRNLHEEMQAGRFREDLFYRVAVGVVHLPPLRERGRDLVLLADTLLAEICASKALRDLGMKSKKLSVSAKNLIKSHPWPGNVRELQASLTRAVLATHEDLIGVDAMRAALLAPPPKDAEVLHQPLGEGFDIEKLIDQIKRHYVERALTESGGKKTRAAELLGLKSHQTLSNWMKQLGTE